MLSEGNPQDRPCWWEKTRRRKVAGLLILFALVLIMATVTLWWFLSRLEGMGRALAPRTAVGVEAAEMLRVVFPPVYHFLSQDPVLSPTELRVQSGLGGVWGRLSLRAAEVVVDREACLRRLRAVFEESGWRVAKDTEVIPLESGGLLFDPRPGEWSEDDLAYARGAARREESYCFHRCRVWVSEDGRRAVAYCETGW